jgi:hypothetical protein
LSKSGNVTLTRYKSKPDLLRISELDETCAKESDTLIHLEMIEPINRANLGDYTLFWSEQCVKVMPSEEFERMSKQIINFQYILKYFIAEKHQ